MNKNEELENNLNMDGITKFTVWQGDRANPVLYTDVMWFPMDEISKVEKILNEFGLKIHAIGADPDADGMYIETEGF